MRGKNIKNKEKNMNKETDMDKNKERDRRTSTAEMGLAKKISGDPWDIIRLCRRADSAASPSTRASTIGAIG